MQRRNQSSSLFLWFACRTKMCWNIYLTVPAMLRVADKPTETQRTYHTKESISFAVQFLGIRQTYWRKQVSEKSEIFFRFTWIIPKKNILKYGECCSLFMWMSISCILCTKTTAKNCLDIPTNWNYHHILMVHTQLRIAVCQKISNRLSSRRRRYCRSIRIKRNSSQK